MRECAGDKRQEGRQVVQLIPIMSNFKQKLVAWALAYRGHSTVPTLLYSTYSSCITIVNGRCSSEGGQRATLSSLWVVSWWRTLCGQWTVLCWRAGDIQSGGLTSSTRKHAKIAHDQNTVQYTYTCTQSRVWQASTLSSSLNKNLYQFQESSSLWLIQIFDLLWSRSGDKGITP